jgi:hypothetical protein
VTKKLGEMISSQTKDARSNLKERVKKELAEKNSEWTGIKDNCQWSLVISHLSLVRGQEAAGMISVEGKWQSARQKKMKEGVEMMIRWQVKNDEREDGEGSEPGFAGLKDYQDYRQ